MSRTRWRLAAFFGIPVLLRAQAAVEYAFRKGGTAVSANAGSQIAGCRIDSTLLSCLYRGYPRAAIFVTVVTCLIVGRWLAGYLGYRAR